MTESAGRRKITGICSVRSNGMKRKIRFVFLSLFEKEALCAEMSAMAEQGWLPEHIFGPLWIYKKSSPRKRRFDGIWKFFVTDTARKKQQMEEFLEAGGWYHLKDIGSLHLFWTEEADAVPLETDALTEVNGLYRTAVRTGRPVFAAVTIVLLLVFPGWIRQLWVNPVWYLAGGFMILTMIYLILLWILGLAAVIRVRLWYRKAERQAREEGVFRPMRMRSHWMLLLLMTAGLLIFVWSSMFLSSDSRSEITLTMLFLLLAETAGFIFWYLFHDRKNAGKRIGIQVLKQRILGEFPMAFLVLAALAAGTVSHPDEMQPLLTMKDYGDGSAYMLSSRSDSSVFAGTEEVSIADPGRRGDGMDLYKMLLQYERAEVKWDMLIDYCWQNFLARQSSCHSVSEENLQSGTWRKTDPEIFGTDEAYRLCSAGGAMQNVWVMRKENIMFEVAFGWTPDEEQLQTAVSRMLQEEKASLQSDAFFLQIPGDFINFLTVHGKACNISM